MYNKKCEREYVKSKHRLWNQTDLGSNLRLTFLGCVILMKLLILSVFHFSHFQIRIIIVATLQICYFALKDMIGYPILSCSLILYLAQNKLSINGGNEI